MAHRRIDRLEDDAVRVLAPEALPRRDRRWYRGELRPLQGPGDGSTGRLPPLRLGLSVVHDQRIVRQFSRYTERQRSIVDHSVVNDCTPTDRTPRHSYWPGSGVGGRSCPHSDGVVDDFVVAEDSEWVRTGWIGVDDYHVVVTLSEVFGAEGRLVDARNGVTGEDVSDVHSSGSRSIG